MKGTDFAGTYDSHLFTEEKIEYEINRLEKSLYLDKDVITNYLKQLDFQGNQTALDIGCGTGAVSRLLARLNPTGTVIGVDREEKYLYYANKKATDEKLTNVQFQNCDCYDLSFEDNYFDVSFSRLLYQHLDNHDAALQELIRVTKPNGKIAICEFDQGLNCFHPEPKNLRKYYDAEVRLRRFIKGDIYFGRKIYSLMAQNGLQEIQVFHGHLDVCNCDRQDQLEMVEDWQKENTSEHPLVRTKLITLDELNEHYTDLIRILGDESCYASFGYFFVIGKVVK